jgi:hypothetical protein
LPGKENLFADALSRLVDVKDGCNRLAEELNEKLISRVTYCNELHGYIPEKMPWDDRELRKKQGEDEVCKEIKYQLRGNPSREGIKNIPLTKFRIIKGIIFVHRIIRRSTLTDEFLVPYVPDSLMAKAFKVIHKDTTAGHKGYERTLKVFIKNFYNHRESVAIKEMCNNCELCVRAKATPKKVPIAKYPIPTKPFQTISSDILGPLPITAAGNQYILVVRDFMTRYSILYALEHKDTDSIIRALRQIMSNYGSSEVLITDNAKEYISEKLSNFCKFYNIKKVEIAPYHPESQGIAERINREINKLLRIYTNSLATSDWDELLPVLQLTINNTYNSSLKETPFFVLYGYDSPTITLNPPKLNYDESNLAQHMNRMSIIREHCRESVLKAQASYTDYVNDKRSSKDIKIGQRVFAKLDKWLHKQKLDLPITGPFIVVGKKGRALKLKQLATNKIYLVHPDYIITSATLSSEKVISTENESESQTTSEEVEPQQRYSLRPR